MKISIASDHGGYDFKQTIIKYLESLSEPECSVTDYGTYSSESCDFPDYAIKAAEAVANGECERGIVVCTTGIGMSICANKVKGIRCALCTDEYQALMTRRHNDANMLALGAKCVNEEMMKRIISVWLNTGFDGDTPEGVRHKRRVLKIAEYENTKGGRV